MGNAAKKPIPSRPGDHELTAMLGRAKRQWDALLAQIEGCPGAVVEWKFYKTAGWRVVARDSRRNLVYLNPKSRKFGVSFSLNDAAVKAAEKSGLPGDLLELLRNSPEFPEGRAVRFDVTSAAGVANAAALLALKVSC